MPDHEENIKRFCEGKKAQIITKLEGLAATIELLANEGPAREIAAVCDWLWETARLVLLGDREGKWGWAAADAPVAGGRYKKKYPPYQKPVGSFYHSHPDKFMEELQRLTDWLDRQELRPCRHHIIKWLAEVKKRLPCRNLKK